MKLGSVQVDGAFAATSAESLNCCVSVVKALNIVLPRHAYGLFSDEQDPWLLAEIVRVESVTNHRVGVVKVAMHLNHLDILCETLMPLDKEQFQLFQSLQLLFRITQSWKSGGRKIASQV